MLFDFFNHDSDRVMRNMTAFMTKVAPRVNGAIRWLDVKTSSSVPP